jgi:nucleoside-diphosphate-sugar epimerase
VSCVTNDLTDGHHKINIASGENYSVSEIAQKISPKLVAAPKRFEPHTTLGDISKAKELLKWQPTINLMDWIEENRPRN